MDEQQLQAKIEEARAAGYTDSEIQAHLNDMAGKPVALEAPEQNKHHEANVGAAQAGAAALGGAAAEGAKSLALPAVEIAAGGYGIKKFVTDPISRAINQMNPNATRPGPGGQMFRGEVPGANMPAKGFTNGANPAWDAALSEPHPTAPPAQPTAMNFLERMAGLARTYAPLARGATGVAAAVTPGNAGQNYGAHFPQTGPQAGREINPATGAPWTAQELQQYAQFTK